jgi:hypothetical protein
MLNSATEIPDVLSDRRTAGSPALASRHTGAHLPLCMKNRGSRLSEQLRGGPLYLLAFSGQFESVLEVTGVDETLAAILTAVFHF